MSITSSHLHNNTPHLITHQPDSWALLAAGCGTAMASVCAIGLFQIEQLLGGLWSVAAISSAGILCLLLARTFARLSSVLPTGAGLLAYVSRGLNRQLGILIVTPYFLLMLLLVGFEARIVGELLARLIPLPVAGGAILFLIITWAICRAGIRIGYRTQAIATWALFFGLLGISTILLLGAWQRGELLTRLLPSPPSFATFSAAVGQAFFLFMGFELLTSHAEVASKPAIGRALIGSVLVLTLFYATVSLGFSCLAQLPTPVSRGFFIPQLAIAEQAGGPTMIMLVTFISILASFTTFNGALLALSRFIYALAAQGILPRPLAQLEPRTLVARQALLALLGCSILFTLLLHLLAWYEATILAAAIAATLVYATATWTRECSPFRETDRRIGWRLLNGIFAIILTLFALSVISYAGQVRSSTLILLALVYSIAVIMVIIQRYKTRCSR